MADWALIALQILKAESADGVPTVQNNGYFGGDTGAESLSA